MCRTFSRGQRSIVGSTTPWLGIAVERISRFALASSTLSGEGSNKISSGQFCSSLNQAGPTVKKVLFTVFSLDFPDLLGCLWMGHSGKWLHYVAESFAVYLKRTGHILLGPWSNGELLSNPASNAPYLGWDVMLLARWWQDSWALDLQLTRVSGDR